MISRTRRTLLAASAAVLAAGLACAAHAQAPAYPSRPVTLYTAFSVGSGPDVVLRILSQELAKVWKQPVVVENRPGGGGFIAMEAVAKLPADGYALLQLDSEHVSALPHLYKSRHYVPLQKFDLVAPLFYTPFMIAVSEQSPWKNVADLIRAAKTRKDSLTYGSWFVGSPGHLGGEWLASLTGAKMIHVPYKEVSQLYTAVANGEVDWAFGTIPSTRPVYDNGKLRYLAIAAPRRHPQFPDVPTVAESGGPKDFAVTGWNAIAVPPGLPAAVTDKIKRDIEQALTGPDVTEKFKSFGYEPFPTTRAQFTQFVKDESQRFGEVIKKANVSLD